MSKYIQLQLSSFLMLRHINPLKRAPYNSPLFRAPCPQGGGRHVLESGTPPKTSHCTSNSVMEQLFFGQDRRVKISIGSG